MSLLTLAIVSGIIAGGNDVGYPDKKTEYRSSRAPGFAVLPTSFPARETRGEVCAMGVRTRYPKNIDGVECWHCCKCDKWFPVGGFYVRKTGPRAGEVSSWCRPCSRPGLREHSRNNAAANSKRSHEWYLANKDRALIASKEWAKKNPEKSRASAKRWRRDNIKKRRCHEALNNALARGEITKPLRCERCNNPTPSRHLHGHHHDYNKPLEVDWICKDCHGEEHSKHKDGAKQ